MAGRIAAGVASRLPASASMKRKRRAEDGDEAVSDDDDESEGEDQQKVRADKGVSEASVQEPILTSF